MVSGVYKHQDSPDPVLEPRAGHCVLATPQQLTEEEVAVEVRKWS